MDTSKQELPRQAVKIFFIVFIFILIAVVSYVVGILVKYRLDVRKVDKATERFQSALEEPYKKDIYGGKTPEETWAMYIDALKKGDIDLASRYYAVGRIEGVPIDEIYTKKQNGQLQEWIRELETLKRDEQQFSSYEDSYYFYNYFNEKHNQVLSSPVVFYLNPHTKVWKIVSL